MSENHYDFCIKSPKWQRNTFFGFLAFGGIGSIVITVLWLIFSFDWGIWLVALLGLSIPLLISVFGLYVWYREKFCFENETFTYVKPFGKTQSAKISDVARVEMSATVFIRVTMIGKNGETLLFFHDDGTALRNAFTAVLMHYNIPLVRK
ncbi:MAG: hypothetical protein IJ996_01375 [Clostridia bacterium]|nr:hypothetical protein [Clostridia bacterium]